MIINIFFDIENQAFWEERDRLNILMKPMRLAIFALWRAIRSGFWVASWWWLFFIISLSILFTLVWWVKASSSIL